MLNRSLHSAVLVMVLLALALPLPGNAAAAWVQSQAIAMHGEPQLPASFTAFPYVNADAPKGGTLRLSVVGSFDSLNPYIVKGKPAEGLNYVYESLLARAQDEPFTLYPLLAESLEVAPDRSAIRFHLNPQARWQDGVAVTAEDVLFSWQTLKTKGRPNLRSYYSKVAKAEIADDHTITFTFVPQTPPDREMPLIMGLMTIIPKHIWQHKPFDQTSLTPPIGSGPYRVAMVEPGRSLVLARDPHYWGQNLPSRKGLYNFDTVRFDYFRDEQVALEAFTAHQVDVRRESDPARWEMLTTMPHGFTAKAFYHHRPEALRGFIFNLRRPLFANIKVREALSLAFDFNWINRSLWHNAYQRTQSIFANSELAADHPPDAAERALLEPWRASLPPALFEQPFHFAPYTHLREPLLRAASLLAAAGYHIRDNVLEDGSGKPFHVEMLLAEPQDEKIALEYSRALAKLGITASIRTVDSAQFQARLNDFDFDMVLSRWLNSLSPGNEQAGYWGSAAAAIKGSRNYAGITSPAIDATIEHLTAATTRPELITAAHALDRLVMWDYSLIPLAYRGADCLAFWNNIATPETTPLYGPVLESWWAK